MTEDDYSELRARLQELQDWQPPPSPWGMRWMDRMPESAWPVRILVTAAVVCYALGFIFSSVWFIACFGIWFMVWPIAEDRSKLKRERRRKQDRADLKAWETHFRAAWQANRVERAITPEWML